MFDADIFKQVVPVVCGILMIVFLIATPLYLNRQLHKKEPKSLPYNWGYFCAANFFLMALISLLLALKIYVLDGNSLSIDQDSIELFLYFLFGLVGAYLFYCRRRFGFILGTILSLNCATWVINYFYGKRRWTEFS